MLDAPLRKLSAPVLASAGARLPDLGASGDLVSAVAFAAGLAAIPALAAQHYWIGLALILLSRLVDALGDAAAPRATGRGAFLDMTFDLIVFAGLPFGFALGDPSHALAACFLVFAIAASGSSAVFAAAQTSGSTGRIVFGYVGRIMEDTELTLAFAVACIMPGWFGIIAYVAGVLCFLTAGARIALAVSRFS
jgi:phosphatidylglycerophosphate synthase